MKRLSLTLSIITLLLCTIRAQEVKVIGYGTQMAIDSSTVVSLKEGADADVYINGKKYDTDVLEILDKDKIETISVLKGEAAMKTYAVDKVIVITTKGYSGNNIKIRETNEASLSINKDSSFVFRNANGKEKPVIVIDGEIKTERELKKLSPDSILSIQVKKDKATLEKYNTSSGVILIATSKKKSGKKDQE